MHGSVMPNSDMVLEIVLILITTLGRERLPNFFSGHVLYKLCTGLCGLAC